MKVLLTGGAGYIGSHTAVELKKAGFDVVIVDNLSNSSRESLNNLKKLIGDFPFYRIDLAKDKFGLDTLFHKEKIDAVIHFAALKSVPESVKDPMKYYDNNLLSTLNLAHVMRENDVKHIIFSSSCSVYGSLAGEGPVTEDASTAKQDSPYGHTKILAEKILESFEYVNGGSMWSCYLRYFNPAGAHHSGLIGETVYDSPALFPSIVRAIKEDRPVQVYGMDYPTRDGSPIRDYVHVEDLAIAHVLALEKVLDGEDWQNYGGPVLNVGTGTGQTVLEVIDSFARVIDKEVKYNFMPRREGDIGSIFASIHKVEASIGWYPKKTLDEITLSQWKWMNSLNQQPPILKP